MAWVPADTGALPLDGRSFADLARNPTNGTWTGPACAISAVGSDTPVDAGQPGLPADQNYSVRSSTHRYPSYANGDEELYDHETDPYEWHNLAGQAAHAAVQTALRDELNRQVGLTRSV